MTLRFIDSFDHYVTADGGLKGYTYAATGVTAAIGRNGTAGVRSGNTNFPCDLVLPGADFNPIIVGFAYRASSLSLASLVQFAHSGTMHIHIDLTSTGFLQVRRGQNGTVLGTGTFQFTAGVYAYVEAKVNIHGSTGSVEVKVNGATDINITGANTQNGGTAAVNTLRLFYSGTAVGTTMDIDDLYVCDTAGSVNNDFLGDVRVEALLPNGNGNSSQLVGSDSNSTDNYLLVDEAAPNGDTDYVESSTVSDKDTYAFGNLTSTSGTVLGVQVLPYARKTDAGTRSIKSVARLSGTEEDSADKTLSTSYAYLKDIRETKPGGGAWSISDVNSAEFGVKVSA